MNSLILCLHVILICSLSLGALRLGKEAMVAWLSLLAITMNLFVLKQINLFGLNVTASDALGVGYLLGLNLIQEYFGRPYARRAVVTSWLITGSFLLLSQTHLLYIPSSYDQAQPHFAFLFTPLLRILAASLFSFAVVQWLDLSFFAFLRTQTQGKYLTTRVTVALLLAQTLDTFLFSFLGLYGHVASVMDIIFLSLAIKVIVIFLSTPFVTISKRLVPHVTV